MQKEEYIYENEQHIVSLAEYAHQRRLAGRAIPMPHEMRRLHDPQRNHLHTISSSFAAGGRWQASVKRECQTTNVNGDCDLSWLTQDPALWLWCWLCGRGGQAL